MSGRPYKEVVADAAYDRTILRLAGFDVLCPVENEGVKAVPGILQSTKKQMDDYWMRDKAMIAAADIMFNMSPHTNSIGVAREHGLMQYGLKRPVACVFPVGQLPKPGAICYYEDFLVTDSVIFAAEQMRRWWRKRAKKDSTEGATGAAEGGRTEAGQAADETSKPATRRPRRHKKAGKGNRRQAPENDGCRLCRDRAAFHDLGGGL